MWAAKTAASQGCLELVLTLREAAGHKMSRIYILPYLLIYNVGLTDTECLQTRWDCRYLLPRVLPCFLMFVILQTINCSSGGKSFRVSKADICNVLKPKKIPVSAWVLCKVTRDILELHRFGLGWVTSRSLGPKGTSGLVFINQGSA